MGNNIQENSDLHKVRKDSTEEGVSEDEIKTLIFLTHN